MRPLAMDFSQVEPHEPQEYFSESYEEARAKFRAAVAALATRVQVRSDVLTVVDPDYTIDIAVVEGSAAGRGGLVVHSSGVHGVEGFAGSAVQTAAIHAMVGSPSARPEVTTAFVHAVNPYGMANFRRWNENNVDLNRNAMTDEEFQEVLARDPNLAGYEDFQDLLVPVAAPSSWFVQGGLWTQIVCLLSRHSFRSLKVALVTGTYRHQKGIFFGGTELQASHRLLGKWMRENFGHVHGSQVVWIDVHTGLGPCGVDVLLSGSSDKGAMQEAFPGAEVQACAEEGSNADGAQAAGYELVKGLMKHYYWRCFDGDDAAEKDPSQKAVILTQEFGTKPGVLVARSLLIENAGYHFDVPNRETWSTYTRDAFYVRTAHWKASVLSRGGIVLRQAMDFCAVRSG